MIWEKRTCSYNFEIEIESKIYIYFTFVSDQIISIGMESVNLGLRWKDSRYRIVRNNSERNAIIER